MKDKIPIWTIITCQLNLADEDFCSWLLFEHGTLGLEILKIDEQTLSISASFRQEDLSKEKIDELRYQFKHAGLNKTADTLKIESLPNENWMSNWKKHFVPFTVGNSLLICPPWKEKSIGNQEFANRTKIIIDPGMAFGTGLHATTNFCLQSIEHLAKGPNILDVGTGSGILSIACAMVLPASHIVAIDIDENSVANAEHNIALNHLSKRISLEQADLKGFCNKRSSQFDTILSNLTAEMIIDCLPNYHDLLAPDGILILAGIIEERLELLQTALSKYPLKIIEKTITNGWVGLVLAKN